MKKLALLTALACLASSESARAQYPAYHPPYAGGYYAPQGHWVYGYMGQTPTYPVYYYVDPKTNLKHFATHRPQVAPAIPHSKLEAYLKTLPGGGGSETAPAPRPLPQQTQTPITSVPELILNVIDADARVFIADQPTTQTGLQRKYKLPLAPGASQKFKIHVSWGNAILGDSETREVVLTYGRTETLNIPATKK